MNIQFTLAARYLSGRKLRTFLTTIAVTFGVLVLFGMNIVLPSMLEALQVNALAGEGQVDVTITHVSGGAFDSAALARASVVDGVRAASASLNRTVNLPADFYDQDASQPDKVSALALIGIVPYDAKSVRSFPLVTGRYLEDSDHTAALITQSLADVIGIKVGETFSIPTINGTVELTAVGILPPRLIPGNEEVFVTLPQAQEMTGEPGMINAIDVNLEIPKTAVEAEAGRQEIIANINAALGSDYKVGSLLAGSEMFAALKLGQTMMSLFGMLALFMGAFIIFNTFRTIVVERRRDIGMLRALGANRQTILGMILIEGLLQGAIGTAAGLILGYLMGAGVLAAAAPMMSKFVNLKMGAPVVTPGILILSIVMGVGVTLLAGLFPALNAGKIAPIEALRPATADLEFKRQTGRSFIVGAVLITFSLLALFSGITGLVGLGGLLFLVGLVLVAPALVRPLAKAFGWVLSKVYARSGAGELAQGNLSRQPSRVAITASASMLGLAVVVAAGGLVGSMTLALGDMMKKGLGSDYLFIPPSVALWGSDVGSKAAFADELRAIENVEAVSTTRFAPSAINGNSISLLGIDPVNFQKVSGLHFMENIFLTDSAAYQALTNERALIPNGAFMTQIGAKVGDTVELLTPHGKQPYRIVAVATDLLNAKITTAYTSQANLLTDFGKAEDVFIQLNLKGGANVETADQAIRAAAKAYPQYNLLKGKTYYESMMSQMNAAFAAMYFVLAMLALPSLIAMINTLAIGVIERTREIGMIRAVGSTRQQIQRMVLAEALILAGIGTSFGIAAGMYLGYLFVSALKELFPLGYTFPAAGITGAIVIGLGFGALAAIIPARQAARLEIVQALRYE
jgi:putative ABC transport system permease protein